MRIGKKLKEKMEERRLGIEPSYKVLEVGSGHDPYERSDVLCDKYEDEDKERGGELETGERPFYKADMEDMPFDDDEFDFVIASHVIEHVHNPSKAMDELQRVAKAGYIECPSYFGELLRPSREYHRWCILPVDDKLIFHDKQELDFPPFGSLFENRGLKEESIFLKLFLFQYRNLFTIRKTWSGEVEYEVNSGIYEKYFKEPYNKKKMKELDGVEIKGNLSTFLSALKSKLKTKSENFLYSLSA